MLVASCTTNEIRHTGACNVNITSLYTLLEGALESIQSVEG